MGLVVTGGGSVGAVGAAEVVVVPGLVTVLGGLQSNEMVGTTMLQAGLGLLGWGGKTIVTLRAPPPDIISLAHCFKDHPYLVTMNLHCEFTTVVPDFLQELRCLQVEPSGMS